MFTEFTSAPDWHYEAPYFWSLYDMDEDPYQLTNLVESVSESTMAKLLGRLHELWKCSGAQCS
jgi:hypothetical protein